MDYEYLPTALMKKKELLGFSYQTTCIINLMHYIKYIETYKCTKSSLFSIS